MCIETKMSYTMYFSGRVVQLWHQHCQWQYYISPVRLICKYIYYLYIYIYTYLLLAQEDNWNISSTNCWYCCLASWSGSGTHKRFLVAENSKPLSSNHKSTIIGWYFVKPSKSSQFDSLTTPRMVQSVWNSKQEKYCIQRKATQMFRRFWVSAS